MLGSQKHRTIQKNIGRQGARSARTSFSGPVVIGRRKRSGRGVIDYGVS